jgi:hypothetical protein
MGVLTACALMFISTLLIASGTVNGRRQETPLTTNLTDIPDQVMLGDADNDGLTDSREEDLGTNPTPPHR